VIFARVPGAISLPIPADPIIVDGVPIATDKLVAAIVAALCIALVGTFYQHSRTGLAQQALADDRQTAMSVGIDIDHHLLIVWAIAGVISVAAGVLWTLISGGGFGVALVGLKVFPIVLIGGLDSILGAIVGAMIIGVLESLGAGYLDPQLGGGFGNIASYLLLIAMLVWRPAGLLGRPRIERVCVFPPTPMPLRMRGASTEGIARFLTLIVAGAQTLLASNAGQGCLQPLASGCPEAAGPRGRFHRRGCCRPPARTTRLA
jgi:branched-chain amino acid transport system permease protein